MGISGVSCGLVGICGGSLAGFMGVLGGILVSLRIAVGVCPQWKETGGYDKNMLGWGGENIDQSLRTWH